LVDLDPDYNDEIWTPNIGEIPPVSELVNQRVKEVITESKFNESLKFWGYPPEWGLRIWDAHFQPPSLNDILTAYRRQVPVDIPEIDEVSGQITFRHVEQLSISDVHQLMVLVDLDKRYQTIFDTRIFNEPTKREARYMYELGAIGEDEVKRLVEQSGMLPQYVDPMTEYLTKFQERSEITGYLNALETAFTNGTITEAELTDATLEAGYTQAVADWKIKTALVRRTYRKGSGKPLRLNSSLT
ncbi:unnamed protein product, partial [marine sediment metagenome]